MATKQTGKNAPAAKKAATRPTAPPARAPAARRPDPAPAPRNERQLPSTQRAQTGVSTLNFGNLRAGDVLAGADRDSFAIPFIQVLQKMSPQLDRNDPAFIDGAAEGDFLNTATQEVYDGQEGIIVQPVRFKHSFTAWTIREKGGGYKGEYPVGDPIVLEALRNQDIKGRSLMPDNVTQVVDTRLHGILLHADSGPTPALFSLTSTQIKKSKRWNTLQGELAKADGYVELAHLYRITTVPESNDKGNWMGISIEHIGLVQEQEHINEAGAFLASLNEGLVRMEPPASVQHPEGE